MADVKLSSKNQIVVPREARIALGLKAGDRLTAVVRGKRIIVFEKPEQPHKALRGLGKGLYAEDYLTKERESWE